MIKFDDNEFKKFVTFTEGKDYNYNTETEDALDKFKKQATKENYFNELLKEYETLKDKLKLNKNSDLSKYKDEILQLLEEEVARRYYFEKGKIEASFDNDIEIKKAIELFESESKYISILTAK